MSTRQYIGARYVPKFFENSATNDTTWAANTAYEPLTIVTYNGNSYTSKKTVPAGIGNPSANAEYWASTGMYNAQVETIREELEEQKQDLQDTKKELAIKSHISNNYGNKKIIMMGDSYAEGTICTGTNPDVYTRNYSDGWMSKLINLLGLSSENVLALPTGGASFSHATGAHWQDLLQQQTSDEDVSLILVAGGANDFRSEAAAIRSGINTFFTVAKNKFPNAIVALAMIGFGKWSGNVVPAYTVYDVYRRGAIENGGVFINGAENIMHHVANFSLDNLHGNANAYSEIAKFLYNYLITGSADYYASSTTTFTPSLTGGTVGTLAEAAQYIHNNFIKFKLTTLNMNADDQNITLNGQWFKLGKFNNLDIVGRADGYGVVAPCQLGFNDRTKGYLFTNGFAKIMDSDLYINARVYDSSANGFVNLPQCFNFQVYDINMIADTLDTL